MLILIRHGESTGNAAGLLMGRIDAPLTERGLAQAKTLGVSLSGVTRVISSPLERARDTAAALDLGLPIEIDERWVELDYGEFDGQPLGSVPSEVWKRWRSDPHYRPPGGETLAEAGIRVRSACDQLFTGSESTGAGPCQVRRCRGGQPRHAHQGCCVLGHGPGRRGNVAALSSDGVDHPNRLGCRLHASPATVQRDPMAGRSRRTDSGGKN